MVVLTGRDIRAHLRGATRDRILDGWYAYEWADGPRYVISLPDSTTVTFDWDGVLQYCDMLHTAGVQPLARESEPLTLPGDVRPAG